MYCNSFIHVDTIFADVDSIYFFPLHSIHFLEKWLHHM